MVRICIWFLDKLHWCRIWLVYYRILYNILNRWPSDIALGPSQLVRDASNASRKLGRGGLYTLYVSTWETSSGARVTRDDWRALRFNVGHTIRSSCYNQLYPVLIHSVTRGIQSPEHGHFLYFSLYEGHSKNTWTFVITNLFDVIL